MNRISLRFSGVVLVILSSALAASCGGPSGAASPVALTDEFYAFQEIPDEAVPEHLFADDATRDRILADIETRKMKNGAFLSSKRIGSNVMVSYGDQGRKETCTYIFEVESELGRTRETLVLKRGRKAESYTISSYEIVDAPKMKESDPMGSSSA